MADQDLAGKRALVTGGASGIGLACVREFAARGAHIVIADHHVYLTESIADEVGGVVGLLVMGMPFSVSAAIGFIALFGISVMDGIIILSQYNELIEKGMDRISAVVRAGELQMRPVLMTCIIAGVGLLPAAVSSGIGSQVQKPLAIVVVGGMTLAPVVILITLPVLISLFSRRKVKAPSPDSGNAAA